MARLSLFNSPFLLGFDDIERALDRVSKSSSDGYPPYNIERVGENDDPDREFLHRGIAARQFQRSFVLAEGIEIVGADLDNGLLHINLKRPVVETETRTIEIKTSGASQRPDLRSIDIEPEEKAS